VISESRNYCNQSKFPDFILRYLTTFWLFVCMCQMYVPLCDRILDGDGGEICSFPVQRILFCTRGHHGTPENDCFSFTENHNSSAIFRIHTFQCAEVSRLLHSFAAAFEFCSRGVQHAIQSLDHNVTATHDVYTFCVTLEIREEDGKGNFSAVPVERERPCFKLRAGVDRRVVLSVQQTSNCELTIERCFGLLLGSGKELDDVHLLTVESMGKALHGKAYNITGRLAPSLPAMKTLNEETARDKPLPLCLATDLIISEVQDPIRFVIDAPVRVFSSTEWFWHFGRRSVMDTFHLQLKLVCLSVVFPSIVMHFVPCTENDEPLLSGSGDVSRECTEKILEAWSDLLAKWHSNPTTRPRQLTALVRGGVPEALRGDVWQLLAACRSDDLVLHNYRLLVAKASPHDSAITRDINRTFPAHEHFKDSGGDGQDALYKICKAYSVYDQEIGYCQGQSFLAAVLLLHMPEEQAFSLLVRIMFEYGLRELFRKNFDTLHCKFFQLEGLMQEQLPDVHSHFQAVGLEAHMYASQWFLTLFTAKFPLSMVFHIIDLLLLEGLNVIFNVALALLKSSREDLLQLDFEGSLKFFRVQLPKRYRTEESTRSLMNTACSLKVGQRGLKRLEKDYEAMREELAEQEDPLEQLKREGRRLQETNLRLEQENDDLAHELVTSKIALRNDLDRAEDKADMLNKELLLTKQRLVDAEEDKRRLQCEALKVIIQRETERADAEVQKNHAIISEYKQLQACECCREFLVELEGVEEANVIGRDNASVSERVEQTAGEEEMHQQLRNVEAELAQTKLQLVEAECRIQDLEHEVSVALNEVHTSRRTWFNRTLTSIKTVTGAQGKDSS
uniref:RAB GTPase activating protein 1 n=1 Tax=Eptatretus burgeri TaxID=7764 RepID=A0A8C4QNW2_EPTBU